MIVTKENQRLYLTAWNYNAARIVSELAKIVENNGGRYKPTNAAIISDRRLTDILSEYEEKITLYKSIVSDGRGNDRTIEAINRMENEIDRLKKINNEPIRVTHTTYISFILDGLYYYYQVDDNPFFDFYYSKTPVKNGRRSRDAVLEKDKKKWLFDCFFSSGCPEADVKEAANIIFNMLVSAENSVIRRDSKRRRVKNTYDSWYHYEIIYSPERLEEIDF